MGSSRFTLAEIERMNATNLRAWERPSLPPGALVPSSSQEIVSRVKSRTKPDRSLPTPTEHAECLLFVEWSQLVTFKGRPLFDRVVKIPNERGKAGVATAKLVEIGLRRGFPDYDILAPCGQWAGLYLEAKRLKDGVVDPDQETWRDNLIEFGYHCEICEGGEQLIKATSRYFLAGGAVQSGDFHDPTEFT